MRTLAHDSLRLLIQAGRQEYEFAGVAGFSTSVQLAGEAYQVPFCLAPDDTTLVVLKPAFYTCERLALT